MNQNKFKLILVFLFFYNSYFLAQNPLQNQYELAEQLFTKGQYFDAITEYKRLLFFDSTKTFLFDANFKIGKAYKMGAKYNESIKYLRKAELNTKSNEDLRETKFEIVKVNLLRHTFERAFQLLAKMEQDTLNQNNRDDINYWRGWAFMLSDDWGSASESFSRIQKDHPLKSLCDNVVSDKYSVNFAKVISYILPGAGQFYTGNYLSGLMSLGWNVLWGYLTVEAFVEDRIFDGIIVGNLLWLRFYRGNNENAEKFAIEKNIEIANKALRYLKNNYEGLKP